MTHQLARSRNRTQRHQPVSRVTTGGESNWRSTGAMLLGAALGGVAMYKGHIMTGAALMAGGLLGGSLMEDKDGA